MKLKLKLGRWQLILLVAVVVVVAALLVHRSKSSGSSGAGTLDSHAGQACTDFSHGYAKARSKSARLSLADKVTASSSKSGPVKAHQRAVLSRMSSTSICSAG